MNISDMNEEEKKEIIEHSSLEFTADGKFTATKKDDDPATGTYTYDEKEKTLVVTNKETGSNDSQKFTIAWEDDLLLLTNEEGTVKLKRQ
jgi:hypothetical protein